MRPLRLAFLLVAIAQFAAAYAAYRTLPATIPIHFGLDGTPDRWARTSLVSWLAPLALLTVTAASVIPTGTWTLRNPRLLNLPGDRKARWLALPPDRRRAADSALLDLFDALALATLPIGGLVQAAMWQGATTGRASAVLPLLGVPLIGLAVALTLPRFGQAVDAAERGLTTH